MRPDGRKSNQIRPTKIVPEVIRYAEGSVEITCGHTRIICTASIEPNVPKWLQGGGKGWVTAEYGMLPRSTHSRIQREKASQSGRTQEISRLIGRSLRAATDLKALGERQITVDCDVIQADGGTRTAAITGGFVALALALRFLQSKGDIAAFPLQHYVAAVSAGIWNQTPVLDLNYDEDSSCSTDMNFVMTSSRALIEVQGTAEGEPFQRAELDGLLDLATQGCTDLFKIQSQVIGSFFPLNI